VNQSSEGPKVHHLDPALAVPTPGRQAWWKTAATARKAFEAAGKPEEEIRVHLEQLRRSTGISSTFAPGMPGDGPEPGGPLAGCRTRPEAAPRGAEAPLSEGPAGPERLQGRAEPGLSSQSVKVNPNFPTLPGTALHPFKAPKKDKKARQKAKNTGRMTYRKWLRGELGQAAEDKRRKRKRIKYIQACKDKAWAVAVWPISNPEGRKVFCFKCHSWKHPGPCQAERLWNDILKTAEGFKGNEKISAYIVATHDVSKGIDRDLHWSYLSDCWDRRLSPRLRNLWGKYKFARTMEATRNGWGHVNIGIISQIIATWCSDPGCPHVFEKDCPNKNWWCRNCKGKGKRVRLCMGWSAQRKLLQGAAAASGFGRIVWLAPVKDAIKFSAYINKSYDSSAKLNGTGTGIALELTNSGVKNQLPIDAPPRLRRVSWSRNWPIPPELVPLPKEWTGELWTIPLEKVEAYYSRSAL